jgi:hypothetical protein
MNRIPVFVARPAFAYYEERESGWREYPMNVEFLTNNYGEAIQAAIEWARGRFEAIIKDMYPQSRLSSLSVSVKYIGGLQEDKRMDTFNTTPFFNWKEDFPVSLDDAAQAALSTPAASKHP